MNMNIFFSLKFRLKKKSRVLGLRQNQRLCLNKRVYYCTGENLKMGLFAREENIH